MDALEALQTRVSVAVLGEPAPTEDQVQALLQAAIRAPDHGLLRPWRFLVLRGGQRARLGELLCRAKRAVAPETSEEELEKLAGKPFRAPLIIVAVAEIDPDNRVPPLEQVVATGAAVQNLMVACHAMGIGAMWRTGGLASETLVKEGLGFQDRDEIVGFIYLGTPVGSIKRLPEEDPQAFVRSLPDEPA